MGLIHTRASKKRDRAEAGLARAETKLIRAQAKTARQQEAQAAPADQPVVMAIPEGFFGASAKPKTFHENNLAAKMTFQAQRAGLQDDAGPGGRRHPRRSHDFRRGSGRAEQDSSRADVMTADQVDGKLRVRILFAAEPDTEQV